MTYNLLDERWLPVRRASGRREWIAPCQITEGYADDPIVALDVPRPDFNGALTEFLIGLLTTAAAPPNEDAWFTPYDDPPPPDTLRKLFVQHRDAFNLDGDGPRFMQDIDPLDDGKEDGIAQLLMDAPGGQALRQNTDLFNKRGSVAGLSPAMAAMALLTLQTYAPAGGAGYRVSMRGGGPLTTIVVGTRGGGAARAPTLWTCLWPNVMTRSQIKQATQDRERRDPSDIFPWLAPTRTSEHDRNTTPGDAHPLQWFWGMPRRIRLDFTAAEGERCALGGPADETLVRTYRKRPRGVKYEAWHHPLSPYREDGRQTLPLHPGPAGLRYRQWVGLVQEGDGRMPAAAVTRFRTNRHRDLEEVPMRIAAFGYDMDNMKARCWYEGEMPLYYVPEEHREKFEAGMAALIDAAGRAASALTRAVKTGLYASPKDVRGSFGHVAERLWLTTEPDFDAAASELRAALVAGGDSVTIRHGWRATLQHAALRIFDDLADTGALAEGNFRRLVEARAGLVRTLRGKKIADALSLPRRTKEDA